MQVTRWLLLFVVLLSPLSIGCGGHSGGKVGEPGEVDAYFKANPDAAATDEEVILPDPE